MDLHPSPGTFPVPELLDAGLVRAMGPHATVVFVVLWDFERKYPECRPSHEEIGRLVGLSKGTITKALETLYELNLVRRRKRGPKNIYELNWKDVPDRPLPPKDKSRSPYRIGGDSDTHLDDETGKVRTEHHVYTYQCPDGHKVRSRAEGMIDAFLAEQGIPHWPNVAYTDLLRDSNYKGKHTADWVLAPKIVLEYWGSGAPGYRAVRKQKEAILTAAGWQCISIDESDTAHLDRTINSDLKKVVLEAHARCPLEDLERLQDLVRLDLTAPTRLLAETVEKRRSATWALTPAAAPQPKDDNERVLWALGDLILDHPNFHRRWGDDAALATELATRTNLTRRVVADWLLIRLPDRDDVIERARQRAEQRREALQWVAEPTPRTGPP